jgi:flagellar hook protein FlgE
MSFQQGLSGLNAAGRNLEVIGNNIANANTIGAKASRAEFADLYAASFTGGATNSPGIGVNTGSISQQFTPGSLSTSGNATDLAINGGGFFQVSNEQSPTQYTRNGQFKVDKDGFVVNNQGYKLMGYAANAEGKILPGTASVLQLPSAGVGPLASTTSVLDLNLDSRAPNSTVLAATAAKVNIQDPATYNSATSTTAYDIKGQPVTVTYYFQKVSTDNWNVYATANGQSINGVTTPPEAVTSMAPIATITFPSDGSSPVNVGTQVTGQVLPYTYSTTGTQTAGTAVTTNATIPLPSIAGVALSTGGVSEPIVGMTLDMAGFTQYGANFGVTKTDVDGNAPGKLTGVTIETDGIVTARYSNGKTTSAGQIELATFRNPNGLQPMGGNAWGMTSASGDPVRNVPGEGNMGAIQSGALEESNVDLTVELVNMMTAQRSYQANAQTIKTQDQILSTLVNMR